MIIVMGVPGAGKTTVLAEAVKKTGWRVVNWGDRAEEIAKRKGLAADRDAMRKLPAEKQQELQREVADSIAKENGKFVLDTHCSVNTPDGYLPGLPFEVLEKFRVERIVLIEAKPEEIIARRNADATRKRDVQDAAKVAEQIFVNKSLACAYSALSGAPLSFIVNSEGRLKHAASALSSLLR